MGLSEPELFQSDAEIIAKMLAHTGIKGGFAFLAERGTVFPFDEPLIQFDSMKFPTPSGKIELASERARADGCPVVPFPHADPSPQGSRLRVLSPASDWTMNSSYANDSKVGLRMKLASVLIHPREAAARGIAEGDKVELCNEHGRLELIAETTSNVSAGGRSRAQGALAEARSESSQREYSKSGKQERHRRELERARCGSRIEAAAPAREASRAARARLMRILVFQHVEVEHPGIFREFWQNDGVAWDTVEFDSGGDHTDAGRLRLPCWPSAARWTCGRKISIRGSFRRRRRSAAG